MRQVHNDNDLDDESDIVFIEITVATPQTSPAGWTSTARFATFATGVMLLCDAWPDVTTSSGADHTWAVVSAPVAEMPLAAFLVAACIRSLADLAPDVSASGIATAVSDADNSATGRGSP